MAFLSTFLFVVIIIAALITSVVASLYAILYLKKVKELGKSKSFDADTVGSMQSELRKAVREALVEIEPHDFADKKLNDLIHERLSQTLIEVKNETLERLKSETNDFRSEYNSVLSEMKDMYVKSSRESILEVEDILKEEFEEFKQILKLETVESQKIVAEKIQKALNDAQIEIEEYKKQRIEIFSKQIAENAMVILKEVIQKNITEQDHKRLIVEVTEKAVEKGFFKKIS